MNRISSNQKREEYLERLWSMKEEERDSMDSLKGAVGGKVDTSMIDQLASEGLVELTEDNKKIVLTKKGEDDARRIIRAHRLAERLIYDVLGGEFESGACEFEHTIATELLDSICTLLGHPKQCPHGNPVPKGDCCKCSARTAESSVIPLTELEIGKYGRVAYINYKNEQQFHKIDALQIRPGAIVKLLQKYPSYVIECENANIALDREVASNISIWKGPLRFQAADRKATKPEREYGRGWGARFKRRRRGRH